MSFVRTDADSGYFFLVGGQWRLCRDEWWDAMLGPKPPAEYTCNGCTASPDIYLGYHLWPACRIHDYHNEQDGPDVPWILGNLIFRINVWRLLRIQGASWGRSVRVSALYWTGVTAFGWPFYRARWRRFKAWLRSKVGR